MGTPARFGPFTPGLQKDYFATTTANVISTAGDATLSVADPSTTNTGKLVNGAFALPETLQANAVLGTTSNGVYAPVGGSAAPTSLLTWAAPASNDRVTIGFKQPIKANDALRTGHVQQDADLHAVDDQPVGVRRAGRLVGPRRVRLRRLGERDAARPGTQSASWPNGRRCACAVAGRGDQGVLGLVEVRRRTCPGS